MTIIPNNTIIKQKIKKNKKAIYMPDKSLKT